VSTLSCGRTTENKNWKKGATNDMATKKGGKKAAKKAAPKKKAAKKASKKR
jgi:hypothetical protein